MTEEALRNLEDRHLTLGRSLRAALTAHVLPGCASRIVIGIAGESGSGKSVAAASLAHALNADHHPAVVLHQDDYFVRPPRANHDYRCADLARVGPHEVQLSLLASHVTAFRQARDGVIAPCADAATDSFRTRTLDFAGAEVLVVEGTYVLLLDDIDVGIFLEATHQETAERRRARNRDVDAPIIDDILAIEHELIAPQAGRARILVDRHFVVRG